MDEVKCSSPQTATPMFRTGATFAGPRMTDVMFAHITSTSWASLRDLLLQRSQDASGSAMSDAPEPRLQSSHMRASPEGFDAALAAGLRALGHEVWVPQESEQQQTTA